MNWKVENLGLHRWIAVAQFAFHMDAQEYIDNMVRTRGYTPDKFRITEVYA